MSWSIGYDTNHRRDVGYGVPATCDHPGCDKEIDRGLSYICGSDIGGGEHGCGLFFCADHLTYTGRRDSNREISHPQLCERCAKRSKKGSFDPTPDVPEWIRHKLRDKSWATWRKENPEKVKKMKQQLKEDPTHAVQ